MEKPTVLVSTPCYGGMMAEPYVRSLVSLGLEFERRQVGWGFHTTRSESLIQRARNAAAAECLRGPYSHLFFIDADIEFDARDVFHLLDHGVDLVAGAYPVKRYDDSGPRIEEEVRSRGPAGLLDRLTDFPFNLDYEEVLAGKVEMTDGGLLSVGEAPTGFMCIRREVLERLRDRQIAKPYHGGWTFFDCYVDTVSGQYLSEDYGFCRSWKAAGGKLWIDLRVKLGHHGQAVYRGDPMSWVMRAGERQAACDTVKPS